MKAVIANDHGALELKKIIIDFFAEKGIEYVNLGVDTADSCDYPDLAEKAAIEFKKGGYDFGILLCGTGIGISISANKVNGIRCALPQNVFAARMAKEHNDANFIAFGGRIDYPEPVTEMISAFISSEFQGGRHAARVEKMMQLEQNGTK